MEVSYRIPAPVHEVFPYFADMKKFGDAHPIIYRVDDIGPNEYLFYEKLRMFMFNVRFTYKVKVESIDQNREVKIYSNVQRGVHLKLTFSFSEINRQTEINEVIAVTASGWVKSFFHPLLKKSHLKLVNEITSRLNKHGNGIL